MSQSTVIELAKNKVAPFQKKGKKYFHFILRKIYIHH